MQLAATFDLRKAMLAAGMALAAALFATSAANGQAVYSLRQDFAPNNRDTEEVLWIENNRAEPVLLTLSVMTRGIGPDGREINAPTNDFEVFPKQTMMDAGQMQVVRLRWRGSSSIDRELTYRLVAEQDPLPVNPTPRKGVKLGFRYVEAIYVVPPAAQADIVLESARALESPERGKMLELVLRNRGNAHGLIDSPSLVVKSGGVTRAYEEAALDSLTGENVLASSRQTVRLAWPEGLPFAQPQAELKFTPIR